MSSTPRTLGDESLNGSWIEILSNGEESQSRNTPLSFDLTTGMQKILLDAQKESCRSSPIGSCVSSQRGSPKSPSTPVSDDLQPCLILPSESGITKRRQGSTDWIWDWSSRPDQIPPKEWNFHHPPKSSLSLRNSKAVKRLFSNEMLSVLIITNILSIVLGAGIGLFISRRLGSRIFS